jgi:excinuclease UvrABC ATPase subunit
VIDIGPKAGKYGGEIIKWNTPKSWNTILLQRCTWMAKWKLRFLQNAVKEMENS